MFTVRLACVRHAASVHPEPGSNSHVKMISKPLPRFRRSKALCPFLADQTLTVISYLSSGYTLKCIVLYFSEFLSTLPRPALDSCVSCSCGWSWNLQGCISVRLSNRCSGFHQRACRTGPFLCASPWETQLRHHIISWLLCQQFFNSFFVPALTDSSEVMSAAALLSGEADYNIGFFHLQQQISRILKL